jgi:hypothetical protein
VRVGAVVETGDMWEPYRLVGPSGEPVWSAPRFPDCDFGLHSCREL